MDDVRDGAEKNVEPVIESASATTSPDNANSGNGAYIVFALVAVLLLVLVSGLSSCASALTDVTWRNSGSYGWGGGYHHYLDDDYYIDWVDDLGDNHYDDWLDVLDDLGSYGHDTHYFSSWRAQR